MMRHLLTSAFTIALACGLTVAGMASGADGDSDDTPGLRDYDDIFSSSTSNTLLMRAKQAMRAKNYSKAIKYLEAAQKLNDEDADVLTLYAEALDEKLAHQADKDPEVFKKCITAYLKVMRNEVGEEAGMNFKGIGIMNSLYNDEERGRFAKKRLKALTGYLPKPWETNDKYLERIKDQPRRLSLQRSNLKKMQTQLGSLKANCLKLPSLRNNLRNRQILAPEEMG